MVVDFFCLFDYFGFIKQYKTNNPASYNLKLFILKIIRYIYYINLNYLKLYYK